MAVCGRSRSEADRRNPTQYAVGRANGRSSAAYSVVRPSKPGSGEGRLAIADPGVNVIPVAGARRCDDLESRIVR